MINPPYKEGKPDSWTNEEYERQLKILELTRPLITKEIDNEILKELNRGKNEIR